MVLQTMRSSVPYLSLEQVSYFERAMETFNEIKGTEMVSDFFVSLNSELQGKEILVAQHKSCSRFIDLYIKECPVEYLHKLFLTFNRRWDDLAKDKFSSHAVEGIIIQCIPYIKNNEFKPTFSELFASMLADIRPIAPELAEDPSGSHVIRCILKNLSIVESLVNHIDKLSRQIVQVFIKDPLKSNHPQFSAVLQAIAALDAEKYGKLIKYLGNSVKYTFDDVCSKSTSRLIESLITLSNETAMNSVYESVFKESAKSISIHSVGNFVLQRWLEKATNIEQIKGVSNSLLSDFQNILFRRPEVILALCNNLGFTKVMQDEIISALQNYPGEQNLIKKLMKIAPPTGAKILQSLCYFDEKNSDVITGSLLDLGADGLAEVSIDKSGTFLVTEFLKSTIKVQAKHRLIRKLMPKIRSLCFDMRGTYVVEGAFECADIKLKSQICTEIANEEVKKKAPHLWRSFRMEQFLKNPSQWDADTEQLEKKAKVMSEFIEINENGTEKPIEITQPTEKRKKHHQKK